MGGKMINRNEILISVFRAMLGNISNNVRAITIGWSVNKFFIRAYFDREPQAEDIEDISIISTEVLADFRTFKEEQLDCIYSKAPINELERLAEWVFIRKEVE